MDVTPLSAAVTKYLEKSASRGKTVLIGLTVPKLSVHDWPKALLAVHGTVEYHGRSHNGGQLLASWQRKVMRYRVRVRTRCLPKNLPSLPESYLLHGADF